MNYTQLHNVTLETLAPYARGTYQLALLQGTARLSGAELRGKASHYKARYQASAQALLGRLRAAGYTVHERREQKRRVLHISA